ncbi:MAG: acyltransferase [Flavobacteriia bacterium]|nr:acyltransferase [Flavobacteriia bacterium]
MKPKNSIYFRGIDSLRAIGALSVLLGHLELSKSSLQIPNLMHLPFYKNTSGHLGVLLFFVISGFLITFLLLKEKQEFGKVDVLRFYYRRILRIWPIYFLALVLLFFVMPFVVPMDYYAKPDWSDPISLIPTLIIYFFIVPNFVSFGITGLGGGFHLGTIGTEEQFYLFWPWMIRKFSNLTLPLIWIIVGVTILPHGCDYLRLHYFNNDPKFSKILEQTANFFMYFKINSMAIGGILAWYYMNKNKVVTAILYAKWIQIIALLLGFGGWIVGFHLPIFNDEFYSLVFGIILFNLATNPNSIFHLEIGILKYLGKISYGIYVYHWLVIYLVLGVIFPLAQSTISFNLIYYTLTISITLLVAHFSYHRIELRFLNLKQRVTYIQSQQSPHE